MDFSKINEINLETLIPVILDRLSNGNSVWFSPKGTSMLPMLRQGIDKVLLSPLPGELKKYDLPLYRRDNGQFVLHRIVEARETYTCIGDNQFLLEPGIRHDQMIGLVTAFTRGKRVITVKSFLYRVYSRFWHYSRPVRRLWRGGIGWLRRHLK